MRFNEEMQRAGVLISSVEEAVSWALRCPVGLGTDEILDIYQMTEAPDISADLLKVVAAGAPTWYASLIEDSPSLTADERRDDDAVHDADDPEGVRDRRSGHDA